MAENTNAQAKKFSDEELRPACDRFISGLRTMRQVVADYSAKGIGPLVAGTQELTDSYIGDNSDSDGRTRLLGYDVDLAIGQMTALVAYLDHVDRAALIAALTKPSVNTQPVV